MKIKLLICVILLGALMSACSSGAEKSVKVAITNDTDSLAYVIGMNLGKHLIKIDSTLNAAAISRGLQDAFNGKTVLTVEQAKDFYLSYMNYALPEKVRLYEDQFLTDIAKNNRSYARTTTGVTYTVADVGNQNLLPTSDRDSVLIRYTVQDAKGREYYSSYERGDTTFTPLQKLPLGVKESVRLLGEGGRVSTWIPARLAYGAEGNKELGIEPNTTLLFDIELIEVNKYGR